LKIKPRSILQWVLHISNYFSIKLGLEMKKWHCNLLSFGIIDAHQCVSTQLVLDCTSCKHCIKYIMIQPQIRNIYIKIIIHFYDKFGNNNDY
jgi:hypothetical protein